MKRLSLMILIGSIIVSAGTCGDDEFGPLPTTPEEMARELCQQNVSSIGFFLAFGDLMDGKGDEQCLPSDPFPAPIAPRAVTCGPDSPTYKTFLSSIQAGRVKIDAQKMRSCLRQARNARQGKTFAQFDAMVAELKIADESDACRNFAVGTVAANQPCRIDIDCAGDQVCRKNEVVGKEYELICMKPIRGKCSKNGGECGKGEVCHDDTHTCVRGVSMFADFSGKGRAEGYPCDDKDDCGACMDCEFAKKGDKQKVCIANPPKKQQGANCKENNDCAKTLYCKGAIGSSTAKTKVDGATCQPRSAADGQCASSGVILNDYFGPRCLDGLTCVGYGAQDSNQYGKCLKVPGVGEDCSTLKCGDGTTCRDQGGKKICVAVNGNVGDPCDSDKDCTIFKAKKDDLLPPSSNYCDAKTQKCALKKAANATCDSSEQCEYGTQCRADGKCQSSIGGAQCGADDDCDSGDCMTKGAEKVCAAKSPNCLEGGVGFILFALMVPLFVLPRRRVFWRL